MRLLRTVDPYELFIPEGDHQIARRLDDVLIERDLFAFADRDRERDGGDVCGLEGDHDVLLSALDGADCRRAEPGRQQSVGGRRLAAALQVSQHQRAGLISGQLVQVVGQPLGYATESRLATVLACFEDHLAAHQRRAFRRDNDGEVAFAPPAIVQFPPYVFEPVRNLRDQNHVGAARDPRIERDPSGIAPHHLDDHHALVRSRRRVQLVDGVGRGRHRRAEAEGHLGRHQVVVNRLGHADYGNPLFGQVAGYRERAVAADDDQRFQFEAVKLFDDLVRNVDEAGLAVLGDLELEWIAAIGRAEDRPAGVNDAAHVMRVEQMDAVAVEQAFEAPFDAVYLPPTVDCADNHRPDHGVQA